MLKCELPQWERRRSRKSNQTSRSAGPIEHDRWVEEGRGEERRQAIEQSIQELRATPVSYSKIDLGRERAWNEAML